MGTDLKMHIAFAQYANLFHFQKRINNLTSATI